MIHGGVAGDVPFATRVRTRPRRPVRRLSAQAMAGGGCGARTGTSVGTPEMAEYQRGHRRRLDGRHQSGSPARERTGLQVEAKGWLHGARHNGWNRP